MCTTERNAVAEWRRERIARVVTTLIWLFATTVGHAQAPTSTLAPDLLDLLRKIKAADSEKLAVSESDGQFLRVMVASSGARHALEIGGASGYSAIWIGLGLRETGGRLTTIEVDAGRARTAEQNIRRAGLADIVTVLSGDAFKEIPRIKGDFDFVFLDAWKRDYQRFLDLTFPRLRSGGLLLAHNAITRNPRCTIFFRRSGTILACSRRSSHPGRKASRSRTN